MRSSRRAIVALAMAFALVVGAVVAWVSSSTPPRAATTLAAACPAGDVGVRHARALGAPRRVDLVSSGLDLAQVVAEEGAGTGLDRFPFPVMTDPPHRPHDPVADFGSVARGSDGTWEFRPPEPASSTGLYGRYWAAPAPPAAGAELLGVRFVDASWSGTAANTLVVISLLDRRVEDNAAGVVEGAVQGIAGQLVAALCEPATSTVLLRLDQPESDAADQLLTVVDVEDVPFGAPDTIYPDAISVRAIEWLFTDVLAPAAWIEVPADGARVALRASVAADYGCDDGSGSGTTGCEGDVAPGQVIDTSTVGRHQFSVTATDRAGNLAVTEHEYVVEAARPDLRLGRGLTGPLVGDDRYQVQPATSSLRLAVVPGRRTRLRLSVQNDSGFADRVVVRTRSACAAVRISYRDDGVDVGDRLAAGTWRSRLLRPGGAHRVIATVRASATASPRARCDLVVGAVSETHGWRLDRMRATVVVR